MIILRGRCMDCGAIVLRVGGMMGISALQIKESKPLRLKGEIAPEAVGPYFESYGGYCSDGGVSYALEFRRTGKGIVLEASVAANLRATCQRCLTLKSFEVNTQCSLLLVSQGRAPQGAEYALSEADLDTVYYDGDEIDVESLVLETVLLELDSRVLCDRHCRGLCSQCGQNLNQGDCQCSSF